MWCSSERTVFNTVMSFEDDLNIFSSNATIGATIDQQTDRCSELRWMMLCIKTSRWVVPWIWTSRGFGGGGCEEDDGALLCFDMEEERMRWMSLGGNVFFLVMCASSWVFPPGLSSWVEEVVSPARESPGGRDDNWSERKSAIEMSCRLSWRRSLLLRELPGGVLEN